MTGALLFVRGEESIWMQRSTGDGFEIDMHGPLSLRRHYAFATEDEMRAFLSDVEGRLLPAGWGVQRFGPGEDRRSRRAPAGSAVERRGTSGAAGTSSGRVDLVTADGPVDVYLHRPSTGQGPWPGVILYMDAFAIRPDLLGMAQRLADAGYVVAVPNLYHRTPDFRLFDPVVVAAGGAERDRFKAMVGSIDGPKVMMDTAAVLAHLGGVADVRPGVIATLGYCMGGGYALLAAGTYPDAVRAAASFHGGALATDRPDSPHLTAGAMRAAVYVGAGELDPTFPAEQQARLETALSAARVAYRVETYPGAKHGFAVTGHLAYDQASSERHWARLFEFLGQHLS